MKIQEKYENFKNTTTYYYLYGIFWIALTILVIKFYLFTLTL